MKYGSRGKTFLWRLCCLELMLKELASITNEGKSGCEEHRFNWAHTGYGGITCAPRARSVARGTGFVYFQFYLTMKALFDGNHKYFSMAII
jgi:hypothetical protein